MSFKIIPAHEALPTPNPWITIFGEPGIGKTSLACSMPRNTLLLDADEGAHRSVKEIRANFTIKIGNDYAGFWVWFSSAASEDFIKENEIQSLIIDTVGTLLDDKITPWLISQNPKSGTTAGGLSLSGWGVLSNHFSAFKTRCDALGLKVCAIAHGKEEEVQETKKARLAVKGGTKDLIPRISDMLGFVYLHGNNRVVDFNATNFHIGKNTAQLPLMKIPASTSKDFQGFMASIYDATLTKIQEAGKEQVEYLSAIDNYRQAIEECEKPADFDAFLSTIADESDKLIQAQVRNILTKAMKDKGFRYSKEEKRVIEKEVEDAI